MTVAPGQREQLGLDRPAAQELGLAFRRAVQAVRRMRGREARAGDALSDSQYGLLFGLFHAREPISTREVAEHADVSAATATQMLESLETAGLVSRRRSERDRRIVLTALTDRGYALVRERHDRVAPRWIAATERFSDSELEAAAAVLHALRGVFEDADEPPAA